MWRHSVSDRDARTIVAARIPILVLHGRHDIVAAPRHGEALARRFGCLLDMLKAFKGSGMRVTGHALRCLFCMAATMLWVASGCGKALARRSSRICKLGDHTLQTPVQSDLLRFDRTCVLRLHLTV